MTTSVQVQSVDADNSRALIEELRFYMNSHIVGQSGFIDSLLIGLICKGHLLLEGAPGLAKTKAVKILAHAIDCEEHRIQFTPDLLPSDLTGTDIFRPETGTFEFQKGPLFHNLILADEINRAPAKVQSALLEAMAEHQITIGRSTYQLPELFMVIATQNPIEQEGTYSLPEAQLDRFLMQVNIDYPNKDAEREILKITLNEAQGENLETNLSIKPDDIFSCHQMAIQTYLSESLQEYIIELILATRAPNAYGSELADMIAFGVSPRGTIALDRCARAHAWMRGADFATPSDVQAVIHDVLRHRIILNFEAQADGVTKEHFIDLLCQRVPVS